MKTFIMHHQFFAFWLGFLLINGSGIAAVLWWAIRGGQFRDQDRARYLALDASPETPPSPQPGKEPERASEKERGEESCSS